jgi:hypothetical protein
MIMKTNVTHSEEVQEILNRPPSGLARWGTLIIWIMFLVFVGAAFFIKVPKILSAPVGLSFKDPSPGAAGGEYMVHAELTAHNREKIRKGQPVLLKINEYPYQEFGMIKAEVDEISETGPAGTFLIWLKLTDGLKTTHHISLTPALHLSGIAEITTLKESILTHLLNNL